MAERRMFSKSIVDSDKFLDMPSSAQNLYFHLGMRADDEGFVNNPKKIQKIIGASDDDVKILLAKKYLILFESGVIVVTHWKIHNYIQKDRFKPTNAISEKALISLDTSNVYTLDTKCIQDVSNLDTQVRLGKDSLGKDKLSPKSSLKQNSKKEREFLNLSFNNFVNHIKGYFKNKNFITMQDKYTGDTLKLSISERGRLYNQLDTNYKDFDATRAVEIFEALYDKYETGEIILTKDELIFKPITKQGAAS